MRHGMRKTSFLKVRCFAASMIYLKDYLAVFSEEKESDQNCEMEFNGTLLNSMHNNFIRQAYVQGFDCGSINFKICKPF